MRNFLQSLIITVAVDQNILLSTLFPNTLIYNKSESFTPIQNNYVGYPKVSGLAAWHENSKWYSSLPLSAFISLFCESV
jgi:hypothetical protein